MFVPVLALTICLVTLFSTVRADPPVFSLRCNPYTTPSGNAAVGAFGPCDNGCFAVNQGGQPPVLTSRTQRDDDKGCSAGKGGNSPCSPGNSPYAQDGTNCDEYPYSTTDRKSPGAFRTLRCVNTRENSSQGAQLRSFRSANGIGDGQQFRQGWTWDPNNAPPFCADASKTNDGTEFKYTNGALRNARRNHARDIGTSGLVPADYSDIDAEAVPTVPIYQYHLANGMILGTTIDYDEASVAPATSNSSGFQVWMDGEGLVDVLGKVL